MPTSARKSCRLSPAPEGAGLVHDRLRLVLRVRLLGDGLAHLEPDPLELLDHVRDLGFGQVVLDREGLELGRFDPAALLTRLDQGAGAFGLEQFGKLALSQVEIDVLSFQRTSVQTLTGGPGYRPFERVRRHGHSDAVTSDYGRFPAGMLDGRVAPGYERFFGVALLLHGPRSRRSWSSSAARSGVIDSIESAARRLAFVSPSVT